ncbi:MAG TPA: hypothetical protein VJ914_21735 [Pseudonocardiaceae bacterium]|nr:hypothetical protein [Pseudonocardiaceae bacterium]
MTDQVPAGRYSTPHRRRSGLPWHTTREKWRIVAVSAAAISAVYGIGYAVTQPGSEPAPGIPRSGDVRLSLNLPDGPPAGATFVDGVYHGSASNEFGTIEVAVTIASGRVSAVRISRCTTFFPQSYVDGLPDKVVSTQSTHLAVVSGATGSWQDFVAATRFALTAATHPKQPG